MNKNTPTNWFKRKVFGWGWVPATWQGWSILIGYMALVTVVAELSSLSDIFKLGIIIFLTLLLILISYKKGEAPRWQWGDKLKEDSN